PVAVRDEHRVEVLDRARVVEKRRLADHADDHLRPVPLVQVHLVVGRERRRLQQPRIVLRPGSARHQPSPRDRGSQLTAFFTSARIFASSAAVSFFSAKATGHSPPSSRFAESLKPNVAYLDLNFPALWKKQTTLSSLAYAGIPYQVLGERAGAAALT